MIWAQAFPFVALQFYEEGDTISKDTITLILMGCFSSWLLLSLMFFGTINLNYLGTFFGTKTAPQYTCELFRTSEEDSAKFRAAFENRSSYTTSIRKEVKEWVKNNIDRWKLEAPSWFKIEMIPDDLLPASVVEVEGGANRRRSSVGLRELVGSETISKRDSRRVLPEPSRAAELELENEQPSEQPSTDNE